MTSDMFDNHGGMLRARKKQQSTINLTVPDP